MKIRHQEIEHKMFPKLTCLKIMKVAIRCWNKLKQQCRKYRVWKTIFVLKAANQLDMMMNSPTIRLNKIINNQITMIIILIMLFLVLVRNWKWSKRNARINWILKYLISLREHVSLFGQSTLESIRLLRNLIETKTNNKYKSAKKNSPR